MKTNTEDWRDQELVDSLSEGVVTTAEYPQRKDGEGIPVPYRPEGHIHIRYPKELKFHVTLEALRERVPQCELGEMYGVPQSLISIWKKAAIETIRGNIHYKQRKRRTALKIMDDLRDDEPLPPVTSDAVQHLCTILRGALRQLERDPAALEKLMKSGLADSAP